jgi:hypothetical protein
LREALIVPIDPWKEPIMRFSLVLSIVAVVCTAGVPLLMPAPGLAYDHSVYVRHRPIHHYQDYSGYLDPRSGHYDPEFQRNRENFGFSGRDPSRVGGVDPTLHPPAFGH